MREKLHAISATMHARQINDQRDCADQSYKNTKGAGLVIHSVNPSVAIHAAKLGAVFERRFAPAVLQEIVPLDINCDVNLR